MSVWDMYEEVAAKQVLKTDTGDERQIGITVATVEENYNKDMPGQIKVRIPVRDGENQVVRWAKVARMYTGSKWGCYFLPEKEDQVILAFEHGHMEKPYIIGSVPRDNDTFTGQCANEDNEFKKIVTRQGNEIVLEDCKDGGGDKDKIYLNTAGKAILVSLDNEKKQVTVEDKEKKCSFIMDMEKECITLSAGKKMVLKAGDSVTVTLNGDSKTITIEADKAVIKAGQSMELKSSGQAKVSGQQVNIEGSSMLKAASSGMTTIGGTPVKIG